MTADPLVDRLRAAGCVFAEDEAALLRAASESPADLDRLTERRVAGVPLEVIVGWAQFDGLRIAVGPGVFVPRQRTVALVDAATDRAGPGATVVDLCCGSGAIGAALAHRRPDLEVRAADCDPVAVRCARTNLPADRVFEGDLYAALPGTLAGRIDVLVVNAPYVPTEAIAFMPPEARDHEPTVALDGGPDGMEIHRRVLAEANDWLAPGGHVLIEVSRAQAPVLVPSMTAVGLTAEIVEDDARDATIAAGRRRSDPP